MHRENNIKYREKKFDLVHNEEKYSINQSSKRCHKIYKSYKIRKEVYSSLASMGLKNIPQ